MSDETEPADITVRAAVNHTDTMALSKNIATNGRLFSVMIAAAGIAGGHPVIAAFAALPVGLSCLVDQMSPGKLRTICALAVYAFAAMIAVGTIQIVW